MSKYTIKMVVLDMAGTTVDEKNVVYKTLHQALTAAGVNTTLEDVLAIGAGQEKHQAIKDVIAQKDPSKASQSDAIFAAFEQNLDAAYSALDVAPIEGAVEAMAWWRSKGVTVVLNTGYSRSVATGLLTKLGWHKGEQFDDLVTASDVQRGRPHPDMIQLAAKAFGHRDCSGVLKAGDSIIDVKEGQNAGCGFTIGVLSGAQTREQLASANPDRILPNLGAILEDEDLKACFG